MAKAAIYCIGLFKTIVFQLLIEIQLFLFYKEWIIKKLETLGENIHLPSKYILVGGLATLKWMDVCIVSCDGLVSHLECITFSLPVILGETLHPPQHWPAATEGVFMDKWKTRKKLTWTVIMFFLNVTVFYLFFCCINSLSIKFLFTDPVINCNCYGSVYKQLRYAKGPREHVCNL